MTTRQFTPNVSIEHLGANATKVFINGTVILFSYSTPVAAWVGAERYVIAERISNTTSRHLKQYGPDTAEKVSADRLARLIAGE